MARASESSTSIDNTSTDKTIDKTETLNNLPAEWPTSLLPSIRARVTSSQRSLVVLDDDPTGTQTVYDVPVLTGWSVDEFVAELQQATPVFYVLTNSRSMSLEAAQALNHEIGINLRAASQQTGRAFAVVSRSDSTLRGHYPGETDALAAALTSASGGGFDATLLVPFFLEGGRYTIGDVHYVAERDRLVPAGETPFARDAAFGYRASNLAAWCEEKTGGRVPAATVASITIADLREGGPDRVAQILNGLEGGRVCIVNAASMRDLEVLVAGLLDAEAAGKRFLYRTAASFVQVRAGLAPRPLLTRRDFNLPSRTGENTGGLFVVGSYVPKTTAQLTALLENTPIKRHEVDVDALLDDHRRAAEIDRAVERVGRWLVSGDDAVLYTSRRLVTGKDAADSLQIGARISESLVEIVQRLGVAPRYLAAKGGITSSDIATRALAVRRALVMGQILPGVPVWRTGPESRYPEMPYIVFPGNVGDDNSLVAVYTMLHP